MPCPEHGYISGEHTTCDDCGRETEVYSRVVGYLRPVAQWNDGKQEEFHMRKTFDGGLYDDVPITTPATVCKDSDSLTGLSNTSDTKTSPNVASTIVEDETTAFRPDKKTALG